MNKDNIKAIEIDSKALPHIGTLCVICDSFIPIDYCYNPVIKICDECKKRLKKILYEDERRVSDVRVGSTNNDC